MSYSGTAKGSSAHTSIQAEIVPADVELLSPMPAIVADVGCCRRCQLSINAGVGCCRRCLLLSLSLLSLADADANAPRALLT
jgi:hypothetical protein